MTDSETQLRLARMIDEGLFERLAMAVLRESDPDYRRLIQTGVNVAGKTIKSPVDGIMFIPGADPPHMIAVHHTTCELKRLREKWLHVPGAKDRVPAGDLVKTAGIIADERAKDPRVQATVFLTTTQNPPEDLVRDVQAEAQRLNISVPIWSNSALSHALDTTPTGQYLRRKYLGIVEERLSAELLRELSQKSLDTSRPIDRSAAWIDRSSDAELARAARPVTFVVGSSGHGKSVACLRMLHQHVQSGGFALVLSEVQVSAATSLDQAIELALRALYPSLIAGAGNAALSLATPEQPFLMLVEDVARSGQPEALLEKLVRWGTQAEERGGARWRLMCPVWPRSMRMLRDDVRRHVDERSVTLGRMTREEGARAVQRRVERLGQTLTLLDAAAVSASLGNDPLLIALADGDAAQPGSVIERYITNRLASLAEQKKELSPGEYHTALHRLADEMLVSRTFDLTMADIARWFASEPDTLRAMRQLIAHGEVLAVAGDPAKEVIRFRHDRVRDSILSSALLAQAQRGGAAPDVLAEPYFAEVIGAALARGDAAWPALETVTRVNPLALFCALQDIGEPSNAAHAAIVAALYTFIKMDAKAEQPGPALMAGLQILADTTSSQILPLILACRTPFDFWACWARCRNGDLRGALALCAHLEPGVQFQGFDALIGHLRQRHGEQIGPALAALLRRPDMSERVRTGALRLAGHLGLAELGAAITAAWNRDPKPEQHLADYMFAAVRCCGVDPEAVMTPICDAWAKLLDDAQALGSSARDSVMTDVRFAFHRSMPSAAVRYLIERAAAEDLRWPITYLLHGVDDPDAVAFVVTEMAEGYERAASGGGVPTFGLMAVQEWGRRSEFGGKTMSPPTRERLLGMWQSPDVATHRRMAALRLWSAVPDRANLTQLSAITAPDALITEALRTRLILGDTEVIPALIEKLRQGKDKPYWWQFARHVWSDALKGVLDEALAQSGKDERAGDEYFLLQVVIRRPAAEAERLLLKHWSHLRGSPYWIHAALFVATPPLLEAVREAVSQSPTPAALFEHVVSHFGWKEKGHPGVTRRAQVEGLVPYLAYLSSFDIYRLSEICNERGWFDLRRRHLDDRPSAMNDRACFKTDALACRALDRMHAEKTHSFIDHWVDQYLGWGVPKDHVAVVLEAWLVAKADVRALRMVADAVVHLGERKHLTMLEKATDRIADASRMPVITNAAYWLRRRSLT